MLHKYQVKKDAGGTTQMTRVYDIYTYISQSSDPECKHALLWGYTELTPLCAVMSILYQERPKQLWPWDVIYRLFEVLSTYQKCEHCRQE